AIGVAPPRGGVNTRGDPMAGAAGVAPLGGGPLTADVSTVVDPDGIAGPVHFQWQYQEPLNGDWVAIAGANDATFTPIPFVNTFPLRVQASYVDGKGFSEIVYSAPTNAVALPPDVQTAPVIVPQQALVG